MGAGQFISPPLEDISIQAGYQKQQIDFVNLIKDKMPISQMMYWLDPTYGLNVAFNSVKGTIVHSFVKETEDDFVKWTKTTKNNGYNVVVEALLISELTRTGTWVNSYPPNYYASVVGATFSGSLKGSEIYFSHLSDNRGGIWRFVIDGDTDNPIDISTYNDTLIAKVTSVVKTGLSLLDTHTVQATFMGDDPLHVPSEGAGTSRGWVFSDSSIVTYRAIYSTLTSSNSAEILEYGSNRDFAFNVVYNAVNHFIPAHSGVATVTKIDDPIYEIDGSVVDITSITNYVFTDCNQIKITQHFYGVIDSTNIAEFWHYTTIDNDGVITIKGKMTVLQNFSISGYAPMLPLKNGNIETAVTSFGKSKVNAKDESSYFFTDNLDEGISVCGVDATKTDIITAFTIDHISYSNRQRETKTLIDILWALNGATTYLKVYNQIFNNNSLTTGYTYRWFTRFISASIDNIYGDVMSLSE